MIDFFPTSLLFLCRFVGLCISFLKLLVVKAPVPAPQPTVLYAAYLSIE